MLFTLQRYEFFSKSQPLISAERVLTDVVYPTKVRIFQQITTYALNFSGYKRMLFTLQRYEFFSKSQHIMNLIKWVSRCCLPYKGTNFSANHNAYRSSPRQSPDVVYPTKVRIFQQITTCETWCKNRKKMLFTLQRYEFFSKSQRIRKIML